MKKKTVEEDLKEIERIYQYRHTAFDPKYEPEQFWKEGGNMMKVMSVASKSCRMRGYARPIESENKLQKTEPPGGQSDIYYFSDSFHE